MVACRPKVLILSVWMFNPYQKLLVNELIKCGVELKEINSITLLCINVVRWKPDVLHIQQLHPFFASPLTVTSFCRLGLFTFGLIWARLFGVKIVWTAHDLRAHKYHNNITQVGNFLVSRLAKAIITHCEAARHEVAVSTKLQNNSKFYVVPHANFIGYYKNEIGREESRQRLNIGDSAFVFLLSGWIRRNKGVLELIEGFKQLKQDQVQLIIAGKAHSEDIDADVRAQIMDRRNILYLNGFVPDDELQVYFSACDVVVLPYRNILTSAVALLAMSFGKACVASRRGCLSEVLGDEGAILFDPDTNDGLLSALKRALAQRLELDRMGAHNKKVAELWSWEKMAGQTNVVYMDMLGRKSDAPGG